MNRERYSLPQKLADLKILIRGAGEMATGIACRLHNSGFRRLLMTEIEQPLAVRRLVSFSEAVHERAWTVEGVRAVRIEEPNQVHGRWSEGQIPVLVDPDNESRIAVKPDVLVDSILAKINLGTGIDDAPLVVGVGPGFFAGSDVHCVVETNRGHDLGRVIREGGAAPNTGVPGDIGGHSELRVIRATRGGVFQSHATIGVSVRAGQVVGQVDGEDATVALNGVLRGLIRPGTPVRQGEKLGDVDPRGKVSYCSTISDKARAIGGSVLEAILSRFNI